MHRCLRVLEAVAPVDPGKGRGVRGTSLPCRSRLSVEGGRVERGVRWNGQPHRGQSFFRLARHSRASGVSRYSSRCWSEMRARMSPTAAGLVWKDPLVRKSEVWSKSRMLPVVPLRPRVGSHGA